MLAPAKIQVAFEFLRDYSHTVILMRESPEEVPLELRQAAKSCQQALTRYMETMDYDSFGELYHNDSESSSFITTSSEEVEEATDEGEPDEDQQSG